METKKSLLRLIDLGYDVTFLRNLRFGDTFQTTDNGVWYILSHYVDSSAKFCYYRIGDTKTIRYYYDDGDKIVFNRNRQ